MKVPTKQMDSYKKLLEERRTWYKSIKKGSFLTLASNCIFYTDNTGCDFIEIVAESRVAFEVLEDKFYRQFPDSDYLGYGLKVFP